MLLRWRDAKIFTLWREISKLLGASRAVWCRPSPSKLKAPTPYPPSAKLTTTEKPFIITALLVVKTYIIHTAGLFLFLRKQLLRRLTH
jgi:hypothetical protein